MSTTGYARVSTDDQDLTSQIDALRAAGCDPIYTEHASGATMERPQWIECSRGLGKGDTLVVVRIDRLGRSLPDLVNLLDDLGQRGIRLQSLSEGIDTTSTMGKLFFQLCATFAEYERSLIRERTRAGLDAMYNDYMPRGRGWPPSPGSSKSRPQQSDERSSSKR